MPGNSSLRGGHAICVVGYDDDTQLFKFKNSWSNSWGDNGYGYLPYEFMGMVDNHNQLICEAWSATDLIEDSKAFDKS